MTFLPIVWIFTFFLFWGRNSQAIACGQSVKALSRKHFGFGSTLQFLSVLVKNCPSGNRQETHQSLVLQRIDGFCRFSQNLTLLKYFLCPNLFHSTLGEKGKFLASFWRKKHPALCNLTVLLLTQTVGVFSSKNTEKAFNSLYNFTKIGCCISAVLSA